MNNSSINTGAVTGQPSAGIIVLSSFISLLITILALINLFGNALVVIAFCRNRKLRIARNYFIFNLAVADLIIALVSVPFYLPTLWTGRWLFGEIFCTVWVIINSTARMESVVMVVFISYDRYKFVYNPFVYRARQNVRRTMLLLAVSWIAVFTVKVPFILFGENYLHRNVNTSSCSPGIRYDVPYIVGYAPYDIGYTSCALCVEYLVPLLLFLTWDVKVYHKIRHQLRRTGNMFVHQDFGQNNAKVGPSPTSSCKWARPNTNNLHPCVPCQREDSYTSHHSLQLNLLSNANTQFDVNNAINVNNATSNNRVQSNDSERKEQSGKVQTERQLPKWKIEVVDVNHTENTETDRNNSTIYSAVQAEQTLHPIHATYLLNALENNRSATTYTSRKGSYHVESRKMSFPRRRLNSCPPVPSAAFYLQGAPPLKAQKLLGISMPTVQNKVHPTLATPAKLQHNVTCDVDYRVFDADVTENVQSPESPQDVPRIHSASLGNNTNRNNSVIITTPIKQHLQVPDNFVAKEASKLSMSKSHLATDINKQEVLQGNDQQETEEVNIMTLTRPLPDGRDAREETLMKAIVRPITAAENPHHNTSRNRDYEGTAKLSRTIVAVNCNTTSVPVSEYSPHHTPTRKQANESNLDRIPNANEEQINEYNADHHPACVNVCIGDHTPANDQCALDGHAPAQVQPHMGEHDPDHIPRRDCRAAVTLSLLFIMFFMFKTPYAIALMVSAICRTCMSVNVYEGFRWLDWAKSLANPFLYAFISITFRFYCMEIFAKMRRCLCNVLCRNSKAA